MALEERQETSSDRDMVQRTSQVFDAFYGRSPIDAVLEGENVAAFALAIGALLAFLWANLDGHGYHAFWLQSLAVHLGQKSLQCTLHEVINDGLLTLFFVLVGIEMRREMHEGELSSARKALLPVAGAMGGMLVPALICLSFTRGVAGLDRAWPIPMATDIAFAVAALALLGRRVFPAMRVFLLTLAVADDMGAVAIIATAFSRGFNLEGLYWMAAGLVWLLAVRALGVRRLVWFAPALVLLWIGFMTARIHPALAGVAFALGLPVTAQHQQALRRMSSAGTVETGLVGHAADEALTRRFLEDRHAYIAGVSPLHRASRGLLLWNVIVVFLFSLANAGVALGEVSMDASAWRLALGIGLGLVVGKMVGITLASEAVIRLGWSPRPAGMTPSTFLVAGAMGGIGFTVANFTADLALSSLPDVLGVAKLSITIASVAAAFLGVLLGRRLLQTGLPPSAASTNELAEQETTR